MSVYQVILGSGWIALGTWTAARSVISLTLGAKSETAKPRSRERQWRLLGGSGSSWLIGIVLVINSAHNDAAQWLLVTAATALLIRYIGAEVRSWRRSRHGRSSAQQRI